MTTKSSEAMPDCPACPKCGNADAVVDLAHDDACDELFRCDDCRLDWWEQDVAALRSSHAAALGEVERLRQRIVNMHAICTIDNCVLDGGPEHDVYFPGNLLNNKEVSRSKPVSPQFDEAADALADCVPIGRCPKCGSNIYADEGFCGGCEA